MTGIDEFAGLGGWSLGARRAGVRIVWAANHWLEAVRCYHANHPGVLPKLQDMMRADFTLIPKHDVFFASPACQGHCWARGVERPQHDAMRATMWAVVECCEVHGQNAGVIENVPEVLEWALYPAFEAAMRALGYSLAPHIVDAADHGVPQNRVRVFIVCTRSKRPLWLKLPRREHVPVRSVLEMDKGEWSPVAKMCANTRARAARGRREVGAEFVMPYYSSGSGLTGRSLDRPLGTLPTKDRWAIVQGDKMRMLNITEWKRVMGFPDGYVLPASTTAAKKMLGNAVCPDVAYDIAAALRRAA